MSEFAQELEALFAPNGMASADRLRALRQHQHRLWKHGNEVRAEAYLRRLPALAADEELAVDLICSEAMLRQGIGERPSPEEYLARFPQYSTQLRQYFQLVDAMSDAAAVRPPLQETITDAPANPDSLPSVGLTVAGYEVLEELGQGGFGVVFKARQKAANRVVALKMIRSGALAGDAERQRFRTEVQAVARLQHPNIVQVFEVSEYNGMPFCSLEYCSGGTLEQKLAEAPLAPPQAARLVADVARGVAAAHQARVLHRDLKPANILLTANGDPRITDFGLAKLLDEARQTQSHAIMGTPPYMAPEQAAGRTQDFSPATDVYALGAVLYECLTGRPPFLAATPHETLRKVLDDDPLPPRRLRPSTPRDLEAVCLKCLEKEQADRYASAEELADDLERFLADEPVRAARVSLLGRVARVLERVRMVREANFRAWGWTMLAFSLIVGGAHLITFLLAEYDVGLLSIWSLPIRVVQYFLMAATFGIAHWPRLLPTTAAERQIGLTVAGYAAFCLLAQWAAHLAFAGHWDERNVYLIWSVLAALTLFTLGATFWGRCYAFAGVFVVATVVSAFHVGWSPLVYGLAWTSILGVAGMYMLRQRPSP